MNAPEHFLGAGKKFKEPHKKHKPLHFRTIWISDIHLGTTGCQAKRLLEFLKATESDKLYLVGDIVDGWQLKRRWYWHQTHNDVVQLVMKKAKKGTKVIFVPGNHDEAVRQFIGLDFGGIKIRDEHVHITAEPLASTRWLTLLVAVAVSQAESKKRRQLYQLVRRSTRDRSPQAKSRRRHLWPYSQA